MLGGKKCLRSTSMLYVFSEKFIVKKDIFLASILTWAGSKIAGFYHFLIISSTKLCIDNRVIFSAEALAGPDQISIATCGRTLTVRII